MSTRYNTGNPIESTDVRDMSDNAKNLDLFSNSSELSFDDRLGIERKTIHGMNSEFDGMIVGMNSEFDAQILNMGFTRVGTFATGATLTNPRQTLLWDIADGGDGQEYGWSGAFPKAVPPLSDPNITGGIAVGGWISRFDPELRTQVRESLRRSYAEAGYNLVGGSFEAGGTLVNTNDVLLQERTGKAFTGPAGDVAAGTDPASGGFVDRSLELLRDQVAGVSYSGVRNYIGKSTSIKVYGRENIFDDAQGDFSVDPSDTTSVDNDMTILVDVLGRRWKRIYYGPVRPEWAGAKRDSVSDDSPAMQKCVDTFSNVELSDGSYRFLSPIVITTGSGITISGAGKTKTLILKDNLSSPGLTRTYDGVSHTYNTPCIFAFVADNDSYVRHVVIAGINTVGVAGDNTQVHYYAPRITYSVFDKLEGAYGKSLFDSSLVSFVNSFKDSRSIMMSIHWNVIGGNAWSFKNTYATGVPTSGGESIAYYFKDTNVQLSGSDGDGLNLCFVSDGYAKVTLLGCNSEARLRIVESRGNSSVDVQGGRHAISVNPPQQSIESAPYYATGSSKISVNGAKAFGYAFNGAVPSNKFLAISGNDSSVALYDVDTTGNDTGSSFVLPAPAATSNGKVSIVEAGVVTLAVSPKVSASAGVGSISTISKSVNFATELSKTLITAGTMAYNERMTAEVDLYMVTSGDNGANSVVSVRRLFIAASNRNTQTVAMSEQGSSISPDSVARTITLSATISGGVVSVTATASHADIGTCYVKFAIKSAIHHASGRIKPVMVS